MEKLIAFNKFDNEDAFLLGCNLVEKVKKENLKNIRIRIVLNQDIVFQYLMNGKKGDQWLNRKQNTVELFKLQLIKFGKRMNEVIVISNTLMMKDM